MLSSHLVHGPCGQPFREQRSAKRDLHETVARIDHEKHASQLRTWWSSNSQYGHANDLCDSTAMNSARRSGLRQGVCLRSWRWRPLLDGRRGFARPDFQPFQALPASSGHGKPFAGLTGRLLRRPFFVRPGSSGRA